jgi:carbonic anhydrase
MKYTLSTGLLFLASFVAYASDSPTEKSSHSADKSSHGSAHWEYSGEAGPENWAKLNAAFSACAGKNQSPVDITNTIEADLQQLEVNYKNNANEVINNGHTIQVNTLEGSRLIVDKIPFELKQFHFHAPSENLIDGKSFAMEGHLVHKDKDGNLAVIAIMFTEGETHTGLEKAWSKMPENAGGKAMLQSMMSAADLLPDSLNYYRFNGSLTTPPCSEGVRWLVLKKPVTASREQIEKFSQIMHHPNNRPVQPVFARPILR